MIDFDKVIKECGRAGKSASDIAKEFTAALNRVEKENTEREEKENKRKIALKNWIDRVEEMRQIVETGLKNKMYSNRFAAAALTLAIAQKVDNCTKSGDEVPMEAEELKSVFNDFEKSLDNIADFAHTLTKELDAEHIKSLLNFFDYYI